MRGGEKVLEALLDLYPEATIFTNAYDPDAVSDKIRQHKVVTTFINKLPSVRRHYQKYLPFMPRALEMLDLQDFDLIISSESGPAKGIIPRPDALHICYCHSPMRYIWDQFHVYRSLSGFLTRLVMPGLAHRLRMWDLSAAARVDYFVANSSFVAARIHTYNLRKSTVIFPPVETDDFQHLDKHEDYYHLARELVPYKRADLAIEAFNASGRKLVVVGAGEMRKALEKAAGPNIQFVGRIPFKDLKARFASCKALVFPGEEDFGIVPVEVMASGRPVVAYGRGGALDSFIPDATGVLFDRQTVESLNGAIDRLERSDLLRSCWQIRGHAEGFDRKVFCERFSAFVQNAYNEKQEGIRAMRDLALGSPKQ